MGCMADMKSIADCNSWHSNNLLHELQMAFGCWNGKLPIEKHVAKGRTYLHFLLSAAVPCMPSAAHSMHVYSNFYSPCAMHCNPHGVEGQLATQSLENLGVLSDGTTAGFNFKGGWVGKPFITY